MPDSYGALAAALIQALTPWLDRPFGFFGHCWSAIAAFEVTVQLEQQGRPPAHLFVSSKRHRTGDRTVGCSSTPTRLDHEIIATVEAMGKTPQELIALYRTVLRHDIELRRRCRRRRSWWTPITYAWSDDTEYDQHHLAAWEGAGRSTW